MCVYQSHPPNEKHTRALHTASIYTEWMDGPCHLWQTSQLTQHSTVSQVTGIIELCTHLYIHAGSYMYMHMYVNMYMHNVHVLYILYTRNMHIIMEHMNNRRVWFG